MPFTKIHSSALALSFAFIHASVAAPGEGVFAINLKNGEISRLAEYNNPDPNPNSLVGLLKYSFAQKKDGTFDFAYQADSDGNLYHFNANFRKNGIRSTLPQVLVPRTKTYSLIGPAYCEAQDKLAFGKLFTDRADVRSISFGKPSERVEFSKTMTVAADLTCGNLKQGLVFLLMDCRDSANLWECLGNGKGQGLSSIHLSLPGKNQTLRLTSPETDSRILKSPRRPPQSPMGDNGPSVFVDDSGRRHLTFSRLHATSEMFTNPKLAQDLKQGGFDILYYKSLEGNPLSNPEYEIDFSAWLPRPAPHTTVLSSHILSDPLRPGNLRVAAFGLFKAPNVETGYDEDVYTGIVTSSFNPDRLPKSGEKKIVLDPAETRGVLSGPELTCKLWDQYGIAPDGNVSLYIPFFPNFLDSPDGGRFITFSTMKGQFGKWVDGKILRADGSTLSEAELRGMLCSPK
jgi:hypothetical protein